MRYYQLREFETRHPEAHDGVVTEKELMERLERIISIDGEGYESIELDWAIDILLHGTGERRE